MLENTSIFLRFFVYYDMLFILFIRIGGVVMGHQESLMFCDTLRDMTRLCKLINKAAADTSKRGMEYAGLDVYEVARLKKDITAKLPFQSKGPIYPKGTYFVWWGGERGPQTQDEYLTSRAHQSRDWIPYWDTVFAEYLPAMALLTGIEQGKPGEIQENEWMRTFHPECDNQISLDLLEQL